MTGNASKKYISVEYLRNFVVAKKKNIRTWASDFNIHTFVTTIRCMNLLIQACGKKHTLSH
jgi:hypothetical protein